MQNQLVSAHGMLAILEVLEAKSSSRDVTTKLLQIINLVRFSFSRIPTSALILHKAGNDRHWLLRKFLSNWVY